MKGYYIFQNIFYFYSLIETIDFFEVYFNYYKINSNYQFNFTSISNNIYKFLMFYENFNQHNKYQIYSHLS